MDGKDLKARDTNEDIYANDRQNKKIYIFKKYNIIYN